MDTVVIFGKNHYQYNGFDINRYIYHDAIEQDGVWYVEPKNTVWNRYLSFFYTNEYGTAFRRKFFIPFAGPAYRSLLPVRDRIGKEDRICFSFFFAEPWFFGKDGFLRWLRKNYPYAKLAYHFTNILQNVQYGLERYREHFDLLSTCDRRDSETYGIPFFPNSGSHISFDENHEPESDCFFVGQAKNRLEDLHEIFDILTRRGVDCEFYINGVAEENQRRHASLHYNQVLDYDTVLRKTEKTNVILELLQNGMDSHTLRFPEAVLYGKKLITNNRNVAREESFSDCNIRVIGCAADVSQIDTAFFKEPSQEDYPNRESVSSGRFVSFLKENLDR